MVACSLRRFSSRHHCSGGFTLVEVMMAVAVIAFAFIPLFGLLPVGFSVSREAMDISVTSQIAQRMTSTALQTDFSQLNSLETAGVAQCDDQGNVTTGTGVYQVAYKVSGATDLPGSGSTSGLKTVTICIRNLTALRTSNETDLMRNPDTRKFVVLVPDNGR